MKDEQNDGMLCAYGYCISRKDYCKNGERRQEWTEKVEAEKMKILEALGNIDRQKAADDRKLAEFREWIQGIDGEFKEGSWK